MSDDLSDELRAFEGSDALGNGDFSVCVRGAAELTRLRAELATARLQPTLNPDRWRGAINDALSGWMRPILEDEAPKDALQRLIRFEVMVNMDPETSEHVADLVHAARRDGMEEAAKIAENEPEPEGEPPIELHGRSVKNIAISSVRATKHSIAATIRAALEGGKKDG